VSFFDDEPDEPTRVTRPARPRRAGSGDGGHVPPPDVARRRQLVAFGALAVVAIVLILVVRSCSSNAHKSALRDYGRNVNDLVTTSQAEISKNLFAAISTGGGQPNDVEAAVSRARQQADDDAQRARGFDVPGQMRGAQQSLTLVLNLRADAIEKISDQITRALATGPTAQTALRRIAGEMQALLASDVVYSQRVRPLISEALSAGDAGDQAVAASQFLPAITWLDAAQVAAKVNPDAGGAGATPTGQPKSGTHGHGLVSVSVGGVALNAANNNRIPATTAPTFDVTIANQGENDESNVKVTVSVSTGSGKAITQPKTINTTKAGRNITVPITLPSVPAKGTAGTVTVSVAKVPGEVTTSNNKQTYTVLFN
jgi:hypothetical protein